MIALDSGEIKREEVLDVKDSGAAPSRSRAAYV
jgi:hypothetical protein